MLDSVTLEGRHVWLEPISVDHIPGLVQAANQSRDTYGFTYVPEDAGNGLLRSHLNAIRTVSQTATNATYRESRPPASR